MVKVQKSTQQQVIPSSTRSVYITYVYYITDPNWDSTGCVCIPEVVPECSATCPEHARDAYQRAE